jgi:hypothetical protein
VGDIVHSALAMRHALAPVLVVALLVGCAGGGAGFGEPCERHRDCASSLQCLRSVCVPRCQRAPDCGDGYSCDEDGVCHLATGQAGESCRSEVDCAPGLKCQLDGTSSQAGRLRASCALATSGRPPGRECDADTDCRDGTCALGHCTDLCSVTRDCAPGTSCLSIPRVESDGAMFGGCLLTQGTVTWKIPVQEPATDLLLPVPSTARHASLVMTVDDSSQKVGAVSVFSPLGQRLYRPCPALDADDCPPEQALAQFYDNKVRHQPATAFSVLSIPSSPSVELETGAYRVKVSSLRLPGTQGTAIPTVTGVVRIGTGTLLDLHFYFLDLTDHPCAAAFGDARLDKARAETAPYFQTDYIGQLRTIFEGAGISIGTITYHNLDTHPELDGIDLDSVGALLALGDHIGGVNVFFARTLSPVGLQAFGPNPGPGGLARTQRSGIVVGVDTLCYRSWQQLARQTAHELARYMGLFHNVEVGAATNPTWRDPIGDSDDSPNNLMFFSELGGMELSPDQQNILLRSPVLR